MTKPITLTSPKYRVVVGDFNDPDTWDELEVQALTRDLQQAETMFAQRKWGSPHDSPIKLTAVSAFLALRRTGQIEPTSSWDQFEASYLEVSEAGADVVGPTQSEATTG